MIIERQLCRGNAVFIVEKRSCLINNIEYYYLPSNKKGVDKSHIELFSLRLFIYLFGYWKGVISCFLWSIDNIKDVFLFEQHIFNSMPYFDIIWKKWKFVSPLRTCIYFVSHLIDASHCNYQYKLSYWWQNVLQNE